MIFTTRDLNSAMRL